MIGFNRFEALKKGIEDGKANCIMLLADFHLQNGGKYKSSMIDCKEWYIQQLGK